MAKNQTTLISITLLDRVYFISTEEIHEKGETINVSPEKAEELLSLGLAVKTAKPEVIEIKPEE